MGRQYGDPGLEAGLYRQGSLEAASVPGAAGDIL
jgi:hypothetical protein